MHWFGMVDIIAIVVMVLRFFLCGVFWVPVCFFARLLLMVRVTFFYVLLKLEFIVRLNHRWFMGSYL